MGSLSVRPSVRRSAVEIVVLSVIFGLAAGAVGMLLMAVYVLPQPSLSGPLLTVLPGREQAMVLDGEAAGRAAVLLFPSEPAAASGELSGPALLRGTRLPSEAVAAGVVLTSDGWILSYGETAAKAADRRSSLTAVILGRSYEIGQTVTDPFTGVVFLKVQGSNLPVTSFSDEPEFAPGRAVFTYDAAGGLLHLDVIGLDEPPPRTADDLLQSSERMQKAVRLADGADAPVGSMVLSAKGDLVAIFSGRAAVGATAVPLSAVSGQLGNVLRDGSAVRPYLGIRYVDLSRLLGASADARRGALVSPSADGKTPAVAKGSPADAGGLRPNDVITAVNGEEVTSNRALSDLLAEYEPGSAVSFRVQRRETVRTVNVVLGANSP